MTEPIRYQNCVTVNGDKSGLFYLQVALMSDRNLFDFNKLLPTPKRLRGVVLGRTVVDGETVTEWTESSNGPQPLSQGFRERSIERFGATNWREWRATNWGCIWLPENVCLRKPKPSQLVYRFETDGIPTGIVNAFYNRFQNLAFSWMISGEETPPRVFSNYEGALAKAG